MTCSTSSVSLSFPTIATAPAGSATLTKPAELGFGAMLERASAQPTPGSTASSVMWETTGGKGFVAEGRRLAEGQNGSKARQAGDESKTKFETRTPAPDSSKVSWNRETTDRKVRGRTSSKGTDESKKPTLKTAPQSSSVNQMPSASEQVDASANSAPAIDLDSSTTASLADAGPLLATQDNVAPVPSQVISDAADVAALRLGQTAAGSLDASAIQQGLAVPDAGEQVTRSDVGAAAGALSNASDTVQIPAAINIPSDLLTDSQVMPPQKGKDSSGHDSPAKPSPVAGASGKLAVAPGPTQAGADTISLPATLGRAQATIAVSKAAGKSPADQPSVSTEAGDIHETAAVSNGAEKFPADQQSGSTQAGNIHEATAVSNAAGMSLADRQHVRSPKNAQSNSNDDSSSRTANPQDQAGETQSSVMPTKPGPPFASQADPATRPIPTAGQGNDTASTIPAMPAAAGSSAEGRTHADLDANPPSAGATDDPGRQEGGAVAAGSINVAKLIHRVNETEMQVGMHSAEFGNIAIKTSVANERLTAEISLEHAEIGKMLANELPGLQSKLAGEYGTNARIEIHENSAGFSGGLNQGASQQSQQKWQPSSQSLPQFGAAQGSEPMLAPQISRPVAVGHDRLDVRA